MQKKVFNHKMKCCRVEYRNFGEFCHVKHIRPKGLKANLYEFPHFCPNSRLREMWLKKLACIVVIDDVNKYVLLFSFKIAIANVFQ